MRSVSPWSALALCAACIAGTAVFAAPRAIAPDTAPQASRPRAADWPAWRGPSRDGRSPDTGLLKQWPQGGPRLMMTAKNIGAGFSSVAVTGGRIYTMGDRDGSQYLFALNDSDGSEVWAARVGPVWEDEYGGPRGTPAVSDGMVFAVGTEGDVVGVDAASGKEIWRRSLVADFGGKMSSMWKFAESPLVDGDRVIVTPGAGNALIVALNKKTGADIWRAKGSNFGRAGLDGAAYSSAVISNGGGVKQYIQFLGRGIVSVRASDGWVMWHYNRVANHVASIPTPIVKDNYVFASSGYDSGGSALLEITAAPEGRTTVTEKYYLERTTFQNHHGGMILAGDHIYAGHGHNRGFPIAVEFLTGKVAWGGDIRNAGTGSAAVTFADGHLYFRYQNGTMMLIEATPTGYREKGSFAIPNVRNPSWSHPVVLNGRLYLREQGTLYVYDVREG
ncbi:MAG: PQQ-like beta-propeller repeat protein [Acidobacteriota bacterium]|nr:PQQ-like beta-propeller repeat protein [Acidobacteriota bacterium]